MKASPGSSRNCIDLPMNSPKVLSRILLYMMALDFLWTILCVMAWCRRRNSRSLCVDSMEADRRSGNVKGPPSAAEKQIEKERRYNENVDREWGRISIFLSQ